MGLYTDLASGTVATGADAPGLDKSSRHQLLSKAHRHDPVADGDYAAQSAVVVLAEQENVTEGNYTLSISLPRLGVSFTTANIAWNATAATIEGAIDTAAPAAIDDGDLAVTEAGSAGLSDGDVTITAGGKAANTPVIVTVNDVTLDGDTAVVTYTTAGQTARQAAYALRELNVIAGAVHQSGLPVTALTKTATSSQTRPRAGLIEDLARVAAWEDGDEAILVAVRELYPEVRQS